MLSGSLEAGSEISLWRSAHGIVVSREKGEKTGMMLS